MSTPCCGPSVSVGSLLTESIATLNAADISAADFEAQCIIAHVLDTRPGRLRDSMVVAAVQRRLIGHLLALRCRRMPLNYVLGNAEFMGLEFRCDSRALSPRPETELLAELLIERIGSSATGLLLDIGCGSGVLGLSVAYRVPGITVVGSDVSLAALQLFIENSRRLGLTDRAFAVSGSYLDWLSSGAASMVRFLVSNPPYVRPDDYLELQPEIVRYEPREALVSPSADGLGAYHQIATRLDEMTGLQLVGLEIGYDQSEVAQIMKQARPDMRWSVEKDYSGNPRIVLGECGG